MFIEIEHSGLVIIFHFTKTYFEFVLQSGVQRMNTMSSCSGLVTARYRESQRTLRVYPSTDVQVKKAKTTPRNITQCSPTTLDCNNSLNKTFIDRNEKSQAPEKQGLTIIEECTKRDSSRDLARDQARIELVTRCQDWLSGLPEKFSTLSTVISKPDDVKS